MKHVLYLLLALLIGPQVCTTLNVLLHYRVTQQVAASLALFSGVMLLF